MSQRINFRALQHAEVGPYPNFNIQALNNRALPTCQSIRTLSSYENLTRKPNRRSFSTMVFSDLAHPPRALGSENVVGGPPAEYLPTLYPKASQHLVEKFRSGSFLDFDDQ